MSSNMHLILIQSPEFMYQFQCKAENQSFVFCKHRYRLPKTQIGTSLLVKWLIFYIPRAGGPSWIPRQGTRSCVPELRAGTAKQILKIGRERDKSISITLVFKKKNSLQILCTFLSFVQYSYWVTILLPNTYVFRAFLQQHHITTQISGQGTRSYNAATKSLHTQQRMKIPPVTTKT